MTRIAGSSRQAGFTLLEVLVAFTILAVALGTLVSAFGGSSRSMTAAAEMTLLSMEARSLVDRVGADLALGDGEVTGNTPSGWDWTVRIQPTEGARSGDAPALVIEYLVEVVVRSDAGREFTLRTLRLGAPA